MSSTRRATAPRVVDSANVDPSTFRQTVISAALVITVIPNAVRVTVTWMEQETMFAKSVEANVLANTTTRETIAIDAPQDSLTFLNANVNSITTCQIDQNNYDSKFIDWFIFVACECESPGSSSELCDIESGQCQCDHNFGGRSCERCEHGFFNYFACSCKS